MSSSASPITPSACPMATSHTASSVSLSAAPYFMDNIRVRRARQPSPPEQFSHSPIIRAMITNNRLSNCHDVMAMIKECESSKSNDQLCRTAASYLASCVRGEGYE